MFKIKLVENRKACAILETKPCYDVLVNGVRVDQLYFNMTGYAGGLPLPPGPNGETRHFSVGERGISEYRRIAVMINRGELL